MERLGAADSGVLQLRGVYTDRPGVGCVQDVPRLRHFFRSPMSNQQEMARLERRRVFS